MKRAGSTERTRELRAALEEFFDEGGSGTTNELAARFGAVATAVKYQLDQMRDAGAVEVIDTRETWGANGRRQPDANVYGRAAETAENSGAIVARAMASRSLLELAWAGSLEL